MTKFVVDDALGTKLKSLEGLVEVCDEAGHTIGVFQPILSASDLGERGRCPIPDEEIERRRQERGGRPLADILADLEKR
jgi:hypothetical protein